MHYRDALTLYQTTNFKLVQIERISRRQIKCRSKIEICFLKNRKCSEYCDVIDWKKPPPNSQFGLFLDKLEFHWSFPSKRLVLPYLLLFSYLNKFMISFIFVYVPGRDEHLAYALRDTLKNFLPFYMGMIAVSLQFLYHFISFPDEKHLLELFSKMTGSRFSIEKPQHYKCIAIFRQLTQY